MNSSYKQYTTIYSIHERIENYTCVAFRLFIIFFRFSFDRCSFYAGHSSPKNTNGIRRKPTERKPCVMLSVVFVVVFYLQPYSFLDSGGVGTIAKQAISATNNNKNCMAQSTQSSILYKCTITCTLAHTHTHTEWNATSIRWIGLIDLCRWLLLLFAIIHFDLSIVVSFL